MKKILTLLIGLLLMTSIVAAFTMPHPIYGKIESEGFAVQGADIKIENLITGTVMFTETNSDGFYQVDLGNSDERYRDDDTIKVTLTYCESQPICSKQTIVSGGSNEVSWDIADENIDAPLPGDTNIVRYVCSDGTVVSTQSECPVPQIECADGTIVEDATDCPEKSNSWIAWVIGIFCALFAAAGGWKFYNGKFKHYHRGIKSYHDPNTQHSNVKYRHKAFSKDPIGCINDVTKIQKGIDLSE